MKEGELKVSLVDNGDATRQELKTVQIQITLPNWFELRPIRKGQYDVNFEQMKTTSLGVRS